MDRLSQNTAIFLYIFSRDNPNGICKTNSKTCKIFGLLLIGLIILMIITLIYFLVISLGFLTSYIVNYKSYDILSGCPLNELNCPHSQIVCNGRNYGDIFGNCIFTGLLSVLVLSLSAIIAIPILYHIINGIFIIINEIYESFKNTKENITIPELSEKTNDKLEIVKLDDTNLEIIKLDD